MKVIYLSERENNQNARRKDVRKGMLLFAVVCLLAGCASSGTGKTESVFEVPKDYSFKSNADYRKYEPDILKCIDYLEKAPVDDFSNNRREINTFFLKWMEGTPDVDVSLDKSIMDLCDVNKNFLIIFMGGWAKYSLRNNYDRDQARGYLAGIESLLKVYQLGNGVKEDQDVAALIKIQKDGKLEEWANNHLK